MEGPESSHSFLGVHFRDLVISTVDWTGAIVRDHNPAERAKRGGGDGVPIEHASEAALDVDAIIFPSGSRSGRTIAVIGYSASAKRILHVILRPVGDRPTMDWNGETAWRASPKFVRLYEEMRDEQ